MKKMWGKIFTTAALACMLCLTGLIMTGEAQARFTDHGNGTVTDGVTGLMWTKNTNPFGALNWHEAMSRCSSFSIRGFGQLGRIGDWRLPSLDELMVLHGAMKSGHPFTGIVQFAYYWSDTTPWHNTNQACAWQMMSDGGPVYSVCFNKTSSFNIVWPVRDAQ